MTGKPVTLKCFVVEHKLLIRIASAQCGQRYLLNKDIPPFIKEFIQKLADRSGRVSWGINNIPYLH